MNPLRFQVAPAPSPPTGAARCRIRLVPDAVAHAVDRRFLSISMDTARIVRRGQPYGLDRPRLVQLARHLSPAFVRFDGAVADRTFYDLRGMTMPTPEGFQARLTAAGWDAATSFARDAGFALMFTLNAGPGNRGFGDAWHDAQAKTLIDHAAARRDPVLAWVFGAPDPRASPSFGGRTVPPAQYAADLMRAAHLVEERSRGSLLAADINALAETPDQVGPASEALDAMMWRPEVPTIVSTSVVSADIETAAAAAERLRTRGRDPTLALWATHSGALTSPDEAQGLGSAMGWVDQLGRLARRGHTVVVRSSLLGPDTGLLDDDTLAPRADFWASLFWKKLMGREVLTPTVDDDDDTVHAYAHWTPQVPGIPDDAVTLLAVNAGAEAKRLHLSGIPSQQALAFRFTVSAPGAPLRINGATPTLGSDSEPPVFIGHIESLDASASQLDLPAHSFAFFVLAPTDSVFTNAID